MEIPKHTNVTWNQPFQVSRPLRRASWRPPISDPPGLLQVTPNDIHREDFMRMLAQTVTPVKHKDHVRITHVTCMLRSTLRWSIAHPSNQYRNSSSIEGPG